MIYIFALDSYQADQYAHIKGIQKQDYRPIFNNGHNQLAGVRNPEVRFVGGWRHRPWQETELLRIHVNVRGGTIIEDDSW